MASGARDHNRFLGPGEGYIFSRQSTGYANQFIGYASNDRKSVRFTIPLAKPVGANVSPTATVNSIDAEIWCSGGGHVTFTSASEADAKVVPGMSFIELTFTRSSAITNTIADAVVVLTILAADITFNAAS